MRTIRSSIIRLVIFTSLLIFSFVVKAETVSPTFTSNINNYSYNYSHNGSNFTKYDTDLDALASYFIDNHCLNSLPDWSCEFVRFDYDGGFPLAGGFIRYNTIEPDGSIGRQLGLRFYHSTIDGYVCPSTHPIHNDANSNGQIDSTDTCSTDTTCDSGKVVGGASTQNINHEFICSQPSSSRPDTYCELSIQQMFDHNMNIIHTYITTGQSCDPSSTDLPVIECSYCSTVNDDTEVDPGCQFVSPGNQFCPADPNDVCTYTQDIRICQSGCGDNNGTFGCFSSTNPSNQGDTNPADGDGDSDGDGNSDNLGLLQDIDQNTDELEKIGRDQIRKLNELINAVNNSSGSDGGNGGAGGAGGDGSDGSGDGDGDGEDEAPYTVTEGDGSFDSAELDPRITQAKQELDNLNSLIRSEFDSLIQPPTSSGGSLPCFDYPAGRGGETQQVCLSTYDEYFSIIASVFLFIFLMMSFYIILD